VKGGSMVNTGIQDGDMLIIDKALEPKEGCIAICFIDGNIDVKLLKLTIT
jgi:DNA polymerase V